MALYCFTGNSHFCELVGQSNSFYFGFFPPFNDRVTTQVFSDLSVPIILVLAFIYQDRKRAQQSMGLWWVCVVGTILLGSFAPLTYLLIQQSKKEVV